MENKTYPLFEYMDKTHDLILTECQIFDLIDVVREIDKPDWDKLKESFRDAHCLRNGIGIDITDIIFNWFKEKLENDDNS